MIRYFDFQLASILLGITSFTGLIFYVIGSIGLYAMANNTGMKNPWLAWIPIARDYLLGSLTDRYNRSVRQKNTSYRFWLTLLCGIQTPLVYLCLLLFGVLVSTVLYSAPVLILVLAMAFLLIAAFRIAYRIFYLISFYYVTMDYEPSRAVLYTVLAFFGLDSIALFLCRNSVPVGIAGRCEPVQPKYNVHSQSHF